MSAATEREALKLRLAAERERNVVVATSAASVYFDMADASLDDKITAATAAGVRTLGEWWLAEATRVAEARKRGWKADSDGLTAAARLAEDVATSLATLRAPVREPLGADEIGGAFPVPTVAALDALVHGEPSPSEPAPEVVVTTEQTGGLGGLSDTEAYLRGASDAPPALDPMPALVGVAPLAQRPETLPVSYPVPVEPPPLASLAMPTFVDPTPVGRAGTPGARRLTWAEVSTPVDPTLRPAHKSHSQVESLAGCGLSHRLKRYHPDVPRRPSWSTVGGNAFHAAVAELERSVAHTSWSATVERLGRWEPMWEYFLRQQIADVEASSGVASTFWHESNGGREGETFWLVEGADMLTRYVEQRPAFVERWPELLTLRDGRRCLEIEFLIDVDGVPFRGFIDQAWWSPDRGEILVVDLKSGRRKPDDTFQLGEYAHAIVRMMAEGGANIVSPIPVKAQYYLARKPERTPEFDAMRRHPWAEMVYRVRTAQRQDEAGLYAPRPSSLCSACEVVDSCPARS